MSSHEICDAPGELICGGGSKSVWKAGAIGMLEVSAHKGSSEGRIEAIIGDGKGIAVGEEVYVAAQGFEDMHVIVPVYPGEWKELDGTKEIGVGYGIENGVLKNSGKHPLTTEEVFAAVSRPTQPECMSVLESMDDYYTVNECDGCSVAGGGASSGAFAMLVAVALVVALRRNVRGGRRATARASSA